MKKLINKLLVMTLVAVFCSVLMSSFAFADTTPKTTEQAGKTLLPETATSMDVCLQMMLVVEAKPSEARDYFSDPANGFDTGIADLEFTTKDDPETNDVDEGGKFTLSANDILACGIKTGHIKLWMIPYYIKNILEFVIALSGLIAVGGFVYGSYVYMFGGLVDEKEKGKKAIMYSVGGMVLTLIAWAVVNIFISIVSSF